ncbi:uncharacterized protein LOC144907878 [Branchiostoma floridae x Branchiostoma belcheri]
MIKENKIHPEQLMMPPTTNPGESMQSNGDSFELTDIQSGDPEAPREQKNCHCHCHCKGRTLWILLGLVTALALVALAVWYFTVPPPTEPPVSNGTMSNNVQNTVQTTSSPRPASSTIHPGTSHQPVSETPSPHTTSKAETSQQPQTEGNTAYSTTDPTTMTTPAKSCSEQNLFECNSTGVCILWDLQCNGVNDCQPDGEDEKNCPAVTCGIHQFTCLDGGCIPQSSRCDVDGKEDCADKSDEQGCNVTTSVP